MTLEDSLDPPMFASNGADKWTRRNVERNGADPWASLTNIGVNVFFGRSPGSIVLKVEQSHRSLGVRLMESLLFVSHVQAKLEHACTWLGSSFESVVQPPVTVCCAKPDPRLTSLDLNCRKHSNISPLEPSLHSKLSTRILRRGLCISTSPIRNRSWCAELKNSMLGTHMCPGFAEHRPC